MKKHNWWVFTPDGSLVVSTHKTHAEAVQMAHRLSTIRAKLTTTPGRYKVRSF